MGISALDQPALAKDEIAVLEISSFQAEGLAESRIAPDVFVVTNLLEDHLDCYSTIEQYHEAKAAVLDHQDQDDWAILPSRLFDRTRLEGRARGRRAYFEADGEPLPPGTDGVFASDGVLRANWEGEELELIALSDLPLDGAHNVSNASAAVVAALAVGVTLDAIRKRLASIPQIEHRQMPVATIDGVEYVNDSAATMPEATRASLRTFAGRDIILIAGGSDKKLKPRPLALAAAKLARTVVLLEGSATDGIREALLAVGVSSLLGPFDSIEAAVEAAKAKARPGSVVLLAPGAASFGMFVDEFDRGAKFRSAVLGIPADAGSART
jgi:UDP-N-acetylmuramoylalanine--D-glutamate ligase